MPPSPAGRSGIIEAERQLIPTIMPCSCERQRVGALICSPARERREFYTPTVSLSSRSGLHSHFGVPTAPNHATDILALHVW
jgi:hypothetical protein